MLAPMYAPLVGKYIRMERPATPDELKDNPDMETIGMECKVAMVYDINMNGDIPAIGIVADYGYEFVVIPGYDRSWRFHIWENEESRKEMRV